MDNLKQNAKLPSMQKTKTYSFEISRNVESEKIRRYTLCIYLDYYNALFIKFSMHIVLKMVQILVLIILNIIGQSVRHNSGQW